jgi:hypothetical protein
MTTALHFIVGVAIGVAPEHSSIAVLKQVVARKRDESPKFEEAHLIHLERLPLDAGYPSVMQNVRDCLDAAKLHEEDRQSDLIVDVTDCGRAAATFMRSRGLEPLMVHMTNSSGDEAEVDYREWRVPRAALIGGLQIFYQTGTLRVAEELELAPALKQQLEGLRLRPPRPNPNDPDAWRDMPRDDLVQAVALAAWRVTRYTPYIERKPDRWELRRARSRHSSPWTA